MAGPYEFLPYDNSEKAPDPKLLPALLAAYQKLAYDVVCLAPDEAAALTAQKTPIPPTWIVLGKDPQTKIVPLGGKKIGLVFFPMLEKVNDEPSDRLVARTAAAADELRPKVDLVVGVSSWGDLGETAFLKLRPHALDILLGAGPGGGLAAKTEPYGETLHSRAYPKGKALNILDLLQLPDNKKFLWELNANVKPLALPLEEKYVPDPDIEALFRNAGN